MTAVAFISLHYIPFVAREGMARCKPTTPEDISMFVEVAAAEVVAFHRHLSTRKGKANG